MKIVRLNTATLRDALLRYGSNTNAWPQELQSLARLSSHNAEFLALIEAEKQFEEQLLSRSFEPAHSGLAERIIAAAHHRSPVRIRAWQSTMAVRPAAIAAMLVIGFVVGLGTLVEKSSTPQITPLQSYSDDI